MELATQYQYSLTEFDFNSGRASPCGSSSPSTPRGFGGYYFSAPSSPAPYTGMIHREVEGYSYGVDYARGQFPTTIETDVGGARLSKDDDYTISRVKAVSKGGGKHKTETIKSPLLYAAHSPKSQHKKNFWSSFSPKRNKESHSSMEAIMVENNNNNNRETREEEERNSTRDALSSPSPSSSSSSSSKGSRKWKLKDLLLFRSASEGRASDKDPLRKYSYMHYYYRKHDHQVVANKNYCSSSSSSSSSSLSFLLQSNNEGSNSSSAVVTPTRKGPAISAHELHYTVNKAISQDMKKKSFLPYKQGILGRLAINPTLHALANGFGSLSNVHS